MSEETNTNNEPTPQQIRDELKRSQDEVAALKAQVASLQPKNELQIYRGLIAKRIGSPSFAAELKEDAHYRPGLVNALLDSAEVTPDFFFGPQSSGELANRLKRHSPALYAKTKQAAHALGLINVDAPLRDPDPLPKRLFQG